MAVPIQSAMPVRFRSVASTWALLAHQGGWDEVLMILAPVAVIAGLLAVAKRRVDRRQDTSDDESSLSR